MTPERWQQIKAILEEADAAPKEQRAELVSRLCDADADLRREVDAFLADDNSDAFIRDVISQEAATISTAKSAAGKKIGPFRITRLLGQGGQGSVYEAVRDDGTFDQRVAIKILKWETDAASRERFRRERQILAGLEHPAIARLLDGGETEDGSPYLVMEFIDGVPLDQAIANWPRTKKLELFLEIAGAVTFAHANLVVHRDLKPGNILVTHEGKPKLLDFGIARLIDDSSTATMTAIRAFTPTHASPEQVTGEPITTASDVYSLGVVLYEMLAGKRPYEVQTTSPLELHRAVCLTAPAAPHLGQDLDKILLMALRKEPARRYSSVRDFSDDVQAFLDFRPVKARGESLTYRCAKFIRRNRAGVAAAAILATGLTVAFAVTIRAERKAQKRFEQVRNLATTFLVDFDKDIRELPGAIPAREKLVSTALQQLEELSKDSGNDFQLTSELVHAYSSVGDVLGMPGLPSLGHTDQAERSYRKSSELADKLVAMDPRPGSIARNRATFTYARLGYLLWRLGRVPEARAMMLKATDCIAPKLTAPGATPDDLRAAANAYTYLSQLEGREAHPKKSETYSATAVDLMRRYQKLTPGLRARSNLARALFVQSNAASHFDLNRALALANESIAAKRQLLKENPNDVEVRRELALSIQLSADWLDQTSGPSLGRIAEARKSLDESIEILRGLVKQDPSNSSGKHDLAMTIHQLTLREVERDPAAAEAHLHEAIELIEGLPPGFAGRARELGILEVALAQAYTTTKRYADATAALNRADALFRTQKTRDQFLEENWRIFWDMKGTLLLRQGNTSGAIDEFKTLWKDLAPTESAAVENCDVAFQLAETAGNLARAYAAAGDEASSAQWSQHMETIWQPWAGKYPVTDRLLRQP